MSIKKATLSIHTFFQHHSFLAIWVLGFPLAILLFVSEDFRESEIYSRIGWAFVVVSLAYLIRSKKIYLILLIPFFLTGLLEILYTLTFKHTFTSGLFTVIAETNPDESTEFLKSYFSVTTALIVTFYSLGLLWFAKSIHLFRPESFKAKTVVVLGGLMLLVAAQQLAYHERYRDVLPGAMGQLADGWSKYQQVQSELRHRPEILKQWEGQVSRDNTDDVETHVVVIGESAVRGHHSLYGYHRLTNPELEKIKDELIIFEQATSPYAVTYLSLAETLTNSTLDKPVPFTETVDVVGLAKLAGFETWWISTQPKNEGTTLSVSSFADHRVYLSGHDEVIFPEFEKALKSNKDKVIFIHLRGSHLTYSKRYPEKFNYFGQSSDIKIYTDSPTQVQINIVNTYDNSIRYTDWVIHKIIKKLKKNKGIGSLFYFSDHGEEIYDYEDFVGHELKRTTPVMFEIPFFMWHKPSVDEPKTNEVETLVKSLAIMPFKTDRFFDLFLCWSNITIIGDDYSCEPSNLKQVKSDAN